MGHKLHMDSLCVLCASIVTLWLNHPDTKFETKNHLSFYPNRSPEE